MSPAAEQSGRDSPKVKYSLDGGDGEVVAHYGTDVYAVEPDSIYGKTWDLTGGPDSLWAGTSPSLIRLHGALADQRPGIEITPAPGFFDSSV